MNRPLSLIIPCYHEQSHLLTSYKKVIKELKRRNIKFELIFIDDFSQDKTPSIIRYIIRNNKNCRAIFHKKNVGRGGTVTEGIRIAKYEYTGFIDIDLEVSEKYINQFVTLLEDSDVVIANRHYSISVRSLHRVILSKGYKLLKKMVLDLPYNDTEAGYKFFRKSRVLPILKKAKDKRWFWDTEIVTLSHLNKLKIKEQEVQFVRDLNKKSSVNLFWDSFEYLIAIIKFRKRIEIKS